MSRRVFYLLRGGLFRGCESAVGHESGICEPQGLGSTVLFSMDQEWLGRAQHVRDGWRGKSEPRQARRAVALFSAV